MISGVDMGGGKASGGDLSVISGRTVVDGVEDNVRSGSRGGGRGTNA